MHPVYLTRARLDPDHPATARFLQNPYVMQGFVSAAVSAGDAKAPRLLYYAHPAPDNSHLVIQSPVPPTWKHVPFEAVDPETEEITGFLENLADGTILRFALAAAPRTRDSETGKNYPKPEEERLPWLAKQLEPAAVLLDPRIEAVTDCVAYSPRGRPLVFHRQVEFNGSLRITDPDAFRSLLINGIGPGKAQGQGLLRVAPAAR
jgi:CRISPR system Cascade subunit CasE